GRSGAPCYGLGHGTERCSVVRRGTGLGTWDGAVLRATAGDRAWDMERSGAPCYGTERCSMLRLERQRNGVDEIGLGADLADDAGIFIAGFVEVFEAAGEGFEGD
ncbi:MAG: hypothetical protein ACI9QL_005464, partial [Candidatus Omnitrophota bacterium]